MSHEIVPTVLALWRDAGGQHWVPTQGTSMLPVIRQGDRILLSSDLTSVRRGSIVVFLHEDRLVAHRVVRLLSDSCVVTKGDNSWTFDDPLKVNELVGHVLAVQKHEQLIALDNAQWRIIGWLIATLTLAVAIPYGLLRRFKQRLWGDKQLPAVHFIRRYSRVLLPTALKPFVGSGFQHTNCGRSGPNDSNQYRE